MKFSDIDFSALSQMMNSMSDEEKERLNSMAENMMENMKGQPEPEEDTDFYEFFGICEEEYADLPGQVLDQIEAACDLEQYYEDVQESDFSASILFLAKAVLNMVRHYHAPIYQNVLGLSKFVNPHTTVLYDYFYPLLDEEHIHKLCDEGYGESSQWIDHKNMLQQIYMALNRAEYDFINYETLQEIKSILFDQKGLIQIKNLI